MKQKSNLLLLWFGFLVLPVSSFVYSIRNFENKQYRIFILLFAMLAGYSIIPAPGSDGESYRLLFNEFCSSDWDYYFKTVSNIFSPKSQITDLYSYTLLFIVSRVTSNSSIFFMVVALIYYAFFIKLIDLIISLGGKSPRKDSIVFFLGCIFIYTFMLGINGVRWAFAFVVFSYGSLDYIKNNKLSSILIASLSVFIHFSLLFSTFFLLIYVITRRIQNPLILIILLLVAVTLIGSITTFINSTIEISGEAIQDRYESYTNESYSLFRYQRFNAMRWYGLFDRYATFIFTSGALIFIMLFGRKVRFDTLARNFFTFFIIMLFHSLISGAMVDPLSNRYFLIVNLFGLINLYHLNNINPGVPIFRFLRFVYLPILILHILWVIRIDLDSINPLLIFGNGFLLFFTDLKESLGSLLFG